MCSAHEAELRNKAGVGRAPRVETMFDLCSTYVRPLSHPFKSYLTELARDSQHFAVGLLPVCAERNRVLSPAGILVVMLDQKRCPRCVRGSNISLHAVASC